MTEFTFKHEGGIRQQSKTHTPSEFDRATMLSANVGASLEALQQMARRRFQNPEPEKHGKYWTIVIRKDEFVDGKITRVRKRVRIASLDIGRQEARKIAAEYVRPMNQGLEGLASATNFQQFVEKIYLPVAKPLMASTTYPRSVGVFRDYLLPAFGDRALRDLTTLTLQTYFSKLTTSPKNQPLSYESARQDPRRTVCPSKLRRGEWIACAESRRGSPCPSGPTRPPAPKALGHSRAICALARACLGAIRDDGLRCGLYGIANL